MVNGKWRMVFRENVAPAWLHHSPFAIRHSPRLREAVGDDGFQGGIDEFHDQGVRRVVGAGGLAGVAGGGPGIGDAGEAKGAGGEIEGGDEFEEGLINGTEFLGAHVPVVDGAAFAGFPVEEPAQLAHGGEEVAIGEGGAVEVGALGFRKDAAESGEGEAGLPGGEPAEDDAEGEPEVAMGIVGGVAEGAGSQPPK